MMQRIKLKRRSLLLALGVTSASFLTQWGGRDTSLVIASKGVDRPSREAFFAFCQVTFVEWTQFLPESEWAAFITDVLNSYQSIAADTPAEANTFKFYQMEVLLTPAQQSNSSKTD